MKKAVLCSVIALHGCAGIPQYQVPSGTTEKSVLKLSYTDDSLVSAAASVYSTQRPLMCGSVFRNSAKVIVISKGNPLITNLNPDGAEIPAEQPFNFTAQSVQDRWKPCVQSASFTPRAGQVYTLVIAHHGPSGSCSIRLEAAAGAPSVADFQLQKCE